MKRSVENTTVAAGLDGLNSTTRSGWPKAEKLVSDLGGDGYLAYRSGSSVIHSQWADLIRNHLTRSKDGHFELRLTDPSPKPQPLYAGATLIAHTLDRYLAKMRPEAVELFQAHLASLQRRLEQVAQAHGEWDDARRAGSSA